MQPILTDQAFTDAQLYSRGADTLVASWEECARGATGATVHRLKGVTAAVFAEGLERGVYNNALLARDLAAPARTTAVDEMETAYAAAGVTRFAAWVHETDSLMSNELERRGYTLDTSTRAMGMALDGIRLSRPVIELGGPDWFEHLRLIGMPPGFLARANPAAFHVLLARRGDENVATAITFDLDGDCGIYDVGTLEHARRRGLGTGLVAQALYDARERGCETASLQASAMAEHLYATAGFRNLGLILEYVPS